MQSCCMLPPDFNYFFAFNYSFILKHFFFLQGSTFLLAYLQKYIAISPSFPAISLAEIKEARLIEELYSKITVPYSLPKGNLSM